MHILRWLILIATPIILASCSAIEDPPVERTVEYQGESYELLYRSEWPVYRVRITGASTELKGNQLDIVRGIIAQHIDPEICPAGQGLDIVVGRKVTPIFLPQVDYHPGRKMFQIFASCKSK